MSRLKFNHVFVVLMLISAACAFVVPLRMTNIVRAQFQNIISPISRPIGSFAHYVHSKLARAPKLDSRDSTAIARENDQLKTTIASLQAQVTSLQQLTAERQLLGDVLPLCTPVDVFGGEPGLREALNLQSTAGLQEGMFALYSGGVVGRIDRAGFSGAATIRLITDPGFGVQGAFVRFVVNAQGQTVYQPIKAPSPLVQGAGNGAMVIRRLPMEELSDVRPGDWVVVDDRDWPLVLHGYKLGIVESKDPAPGAPLFAEIRVRPVTNLLQLRQVMVMTKSADGAVRSAKTE